MAEYFSHFVRILFSLNSAYAKFRENKTLVDISKFTLPWNFTKELLEIDHHGHFPIIPL